MAVGQHLSLRLFLEGYEVPVISANLSIQPDAPAQCQIQIPATDKAHELHPRTLVHLFFKDYYGGPSDAATVSVGNVDQAATSDEVAEAENDRPLSESARSVIAAPSANQRMQILRDMPPELRTSVLRELPNELRRSMLRGLPDELRAEQPEGDLPATDGSTAAGAIRSDQHTGSDDGGSSYTEEPELEDRLWKIFFTGEVIGYQFVKSDSQRSIILSCLDLSVYWDTCYQYQVNVSSLTGNGTAQFIGAGTTLFDTFFSSATSTIIDVVNRRSRARPELTGLLSGIVHLLERVGGVYNSRRGFRGVNDFFTMAELRFHLIDMLAASESDTSSQRLFPRRAFNRWTRSSGGRLGKIASFREILNLLNKFIFHNTIPNPIAMYQSADSFERARTRRVATGASVTRVFTSTTRGLQISGEVVAHMTTLRSYVNTTLNPRVGRMSGQLNSLADAIRATKIGVQPYQSRYSIQGAHSALHAAGVAVRALATTLRTQEQTWTSVDNLEEETVHEANYRYWFANAGQARRTVALTKLAEAHRIMHGGQATIPITRSEGYTETVIESSRLNSQIIRPDIFMCSPPRCNVIFPELYNQVQFSRQHMREVTRMRLTVTDEIFGSDALLNSVYYAPDVEVLGTNSRVRQSRSRRDDAENATLRRAAYAGRLMDHELYTGVVPVFERMSEVNMVASRTRQVSYRGARVPYVSRAANFQFFKNRWSSRAMSASGKFNPWAVCGFPSLLIDAPMTVEQVQLSGMRGVSFLDEAFSQNYPGLVRNKDGTVTPGEDWGPLDAWAILRQTAPTQFIGLIMGLNHSINQSSASTSYTYSTARTHRDNDELLGANRYTIRRRTDANSTDSLTVAAPEQDPPRIGQMGPNYGTITAVERLTQQTGEHLLFGTFRSGGPRRTDLEAEVGLTQKAEAYGPEVVTLVGDEDTMVTFVAYRITEDQEGETAEVNVPIEDFMRPPWMSDVWRNDQIGGTYNQFFGTGSITDQTVISMGQRSATPTADAEDQSADAASRARGPQDPIRDDGTTVQDAEMAISIERAVDLLVRSYSALQHQSGMDVNEFVRAYNWRPVADMVDMLGSRDLKINPANGRVNSGVEGFHSRAFGHGENGANLRNLIPPEEGEGARPVRYILGIPTASGERSEEGQNRNDNLVRIDKRAPRAAKVAAYVDELYRSRGQLG